MLDGGTSGPAVGEPSGRGQARPARSRIRRRLLLLTALATTVVLSVALSVTRGAAPRPTTPEETGAGPTSRPFLAYSEDSFFRTPLPDDAPVDPQNRRGIGFIKRVDSVDHPVIRGVGGNPWGMPFAVGTCADPVWTLTGRVQEEVSFLADEGFHAPPGFERSLTGTSDSPFVVIDTCGTSAMPEGLTVWGFQAESAGRQTIRVQNAGAFQHDSNGLDARNPRSDSALNFTGRGVIPDAMVVRDDELAWAMANDGDLGHVLHMYWWETDTSAGFVHPMVGEESGKHGFGATGMRIRISPDVDLASRECSPAGLVVARTLQRYGAYLGDNSGSSTGIKAEQDSRLITEDALECLSWDDFEFVQRGWDRDG